MLTRSNSETTNNSLPSSPSGGQLGSASSGLPDGTSSGRSGRRSHRGSVVDPSIHQPKMQKLLHQAMPTNPFVTFCKRVADNTHFSNFTTLLTIYALIGDDIRLIHTDKPSDIIFDIMTVSILVIFSLEIIAYCFGKDDYFLGFFFTLDVISTSSLILDISTVNEGLFDGGDEKSAGGASEGGEVARASRASRAGTKAGRIVRLVRLVRIVKLYKRAVEQQEKKGKALQNPGDEWNNNFDDDDEAHRKESTVSKKLSEMTTRRVIVLVLTMLFVLPWFQVTAYRDTLAKSTQYGANAVYIEFERSLTEWEMHKHVGNATHRDLYLRSEERRLYEEMLLFYIYYHNWYSYLHGCHSPKWDMTAMPSCPADYMGGLFWIGVYGDDTHDFSRLVHPQHPHWNPATSRGIHKSNPDWYFSFGQLPDQTQKEIASPWQNSCFDRVKSISLATSEDQRLKCPVDLRWLEKGRYSPHVLKPGSATDFNFLFIFDIRRQVRFESLLNILQTVYICIILGFGAMTFSKDANKLVLQPIERMILKLEKIRNNPLEAVNIGDEEHRKEQKQKKGFRQSAWRKVTQMQLFSRSARLKRFIIRCMPAKAPKKKKERDTEPMETVILEKTIIKIGSLLALGFGEAGAEIIGQNMKGSESSALNAMIPGKKVDAIFGFCDIRNFTDATEVLQDQVMLFVNRIAGVVHQCVDDFKGAPNKNIGDAFLLVWRLSGQHPKKQQRLADMALISFVKIIAQINRSADLAEYRNHPKLVKRMPNYRVRMGFGLHSGWAIEGAIGSEFKIDASYLSPHVNMASSLEGATKGFGVLILISEALVCLLSPDLAEGCRLIDHIAVKGSKNPLYLYTFDLDEMALEVERLPQYQAAQKQKTAKDKFRLRQERLANKNERWRDSYNLSELFHTDDDLVTMRRKFTPEFFCKFEMAFLNYEAGEWRVANDMLTVTRFLLDTEDGPSAALLKFMTAYDFVPPPCWQGHREL